MRISSDENDPGFPSFERSKRDRLRVLIYLDGNEMNEVETADENAGFLVRFCTDKEGELVLAPAGDEVQREILTGDVRVVQVPY